MNISETIKKKIAADKLTANEQGRKYLAMKRFLIKNSRVYKFAVQPVYLKDSLGIVIFACVITALGLIMLAQFNILKQDIGAVMAEQENFDSIGLGLE